MKYKSMYACIWVGLLGGTLIGIGQLFLMGFMPPLNPSLSGAQVANYFRTHQEAILAGAIFLQMGYAGVIFFAMPLSQLIAKIEAPSRLWTYTFLVGTSIAYIASFLTYAFWSATAYRTDRPDDLFLALNDLTCLMYVAVVSPAWIQFGAMGFAILQDRSANPIYPRWIGYVNLMTALGSMPSAFVGFFKRGPFAWDGLIGFWVPIPVFFIWLFVVFFYTERVLRRLIREEAQAGVPVTA
jgi:hypothetical protein